MKKIQSSDAVKVEDLVSVKIILPTQTVVVGPGTVPTSAASVSQTSIKEMSHELREASRDGVFDKPTEKGRNANFSA